MADEPTTDVVRPGHGVSVWPGGRWVAHCRYHGLLAAAPVQGLVRARWSTHLARECLAATVEERSSEVHDADGNLTGYLVSVALWRSVRASLARGDEPDYPPAATEEANRG